MNVELKPRLDILDVKTVESAEEQLLKYLMIYKKCKTPEERREVQEIIKAWEAWIQYLRDTVEA